MYFKLGVWVVRCMLVWGTANPEVLTVSQCSANSAYVCASDVCVGGVQGLHESYNGFFFKGSDIDRAVRDVVGKPVKVEHKGVDVGTVLSAWVDNGKLDLLLKINSGVVEGALVAGLIEAGGAKRAQFLRLFP
jgi:hypothetical protein